jgi:hypothetical protein
MTQRSTINDSDQGKRVVNSNGDEIGIVVEVKNNTAHVTPDPGLTDRIRAKLGWDEDDTDTYALPERSVETITDDEIRLGKQM